MFAEVADRARSGHLARLAQLARASGERSGVGRARAVLVGLLLFALFGLTAIVAGPTGESRPVGSGADLTVWIPPLEYALLAGLVTVLLAQFRLLRGLTTVIANATGLDTRLAEDPLTCVARGTSVYLENLELWKDTMESDEDDL